jgi:four helix bundle protein
MATIGRFEDIAAWQKAREMTRVVYRCSKRGEFSRDFGLRDQIRRSSSSIMANIAEGYERDGNKEFVQFLSQAKGSCGEVRSHLYVALDQEYVSREEFETIRGAAAEISKMISGLMSYLRRVDKRGRKYQQ